MGTTTTTPKILRNILKALERLLPQVGTNGVLFPDSSPDLWNDGFWKDALCAPQGNAAYQLKKNVGQAELRPHILPMIQLGWNRDGEHIIDAGVWFERMRKVLKKRKNITNEEKLALRDLCEMHGHKIHAFLPQVFQREEMRQERDCKVHPHSGARSAVQIQCPQGHDCRYVKVSAAGASRLVNNPIVVCGQEGPRYLISHQYECQQCLTLLSNRTAPKGTAKKFFGHTRAVTKQLPFSCKPDIEFVDGGDISDGGGTAENTKKRTDSRISSGLLRSCFGMQTVSEVQSAVREQYFQKSGRSFLRCSLNISCLWKIGL